MDEAVQHQSHKSFKIFAGTLGAGNSIDDINEAIGKFVNENGVAAKSIGVEFLESANRLIFTLGYSFEPQINADETRFCKKENPRFIRDLKYSLIR